MTYFIVLYYIIACVVLSYEKSGAQLYECLAKHKMGAKQFEKKFSRIVLIFMQLNRIVIVIVQRVFC